jgi:hypothetical protein
MSQGEARGARGENKAHIAQSVEHFLGKEEVTGSIPVMGSSVNGEPASPR